MGAEGQKWATKKWTVDLSEGACQQSTMINKYKNTLVKPIIASQL